MSVFEYTLTMLRRAAEKSFTWPVSPAEAGELVKEVERLRERLEVRIQHGHNLRTMLESATETERAAVVAWLTRTHGWTCDDCGFNIADLADAIERGEHRREEEG